MALLSTEGSTRDPEFFRSVASLGIQAAEALEHAHRMGVVHRDVKPSNLMVESTLPSPSGRGAGGEGAGGEGRGARGPHLWITDFGLAHIGTPSPVAGEGRGEGANLTMTGDLLGTLRYMSPEQVQAKHGVLDHRTDVYSLGLTLYELLTLQPAFPGDDRQKLIRQVIEEDPRPPRQLNKSIPKDLETILLKTTAKEPKARYATAQELADDLRRFLDREPVQARRPSLTERGAKWSRRHQTVVWAVLVTLAVAVAAISVSTVLIVRAYRLVEANLEMLSGLTASILDPVREQPRDFNTTIETWNRLIEVNPDSAMCYRGRGLVYGEYGYFDEAIADMTEAIRLGHAQAGCYRCRGWYHMEKSELDKALSD